MKVGDLVRSWLTHEGQTALVLAIKFNNGCRQATVQWGDGKVQYFDCNGLKVINASR
jgi:hypothetical protein